MRASFLFGEVFRGLRRNVTITLAMILTIAVSLTMLGGGFLSVRMVDKIEHYFSGRVELRFVMNEEVSRTDQDCSAEACKSLVADLKNVPGVESVQFVSRAAAVRLVQESWKDQPAMVESLTQTPFPAIVRVKSADPKQYPDLIKQFKDHAGVKFATSDQEVINRLISMFNGLRNAAFGLALMMGLAALLLIANMVQIAAFTRRTEVGIMRLVGATRWYTQLPFLLEAVVAAVIGAFLAVAGLFVARPLVIDRVLGQLFDENVFPRITGEDIATVAFYIAPIGIIVAAIAAYATLRLYVRE
ncbi:permease-like cell division protein FtsX [Nocardia sp. NPDC052566]|uniref:permease-like cell division protein FtsX n=1 Tax=Nocardia sp. NPDC052566 TaxID=3364330 RepID=UPI0037C64007